LPWGVCSGVFFFPFPVILVFLFSPSIQLCFQKSEVFSPPLFKGNICFCPFGADNQLGVCWRSFSFSFFARRRRGNLRFPSHPRGSTFSRLHCTIFFLIFDFCGLSAGRFLGPPDANFTLVTFREIIFWAQLEGVQPLLGNTPYFFWYEFHRGFCALAPLAHFKFFSRVFFVTEG